MKKALIIIEMDQLDDLATNERFRKYVHDQLGTYRHRAKPYVLQKIFVEIVDNDKEFSLYEKTGTPAQNPTSN